VVVLVLQLEAADVGPLDRIVLLHRTGLACWQADLWLAVSHTQGWMYRILVAMNMAIFSPVCCAELSGGM
jgi:hypothetical protein